MTMLDRALDLLRSAPDRTFTLTELREFAGVKIRSQYKLREQLRRSPEAIQVGSGRFRYQPDLSIGMDIELKKLGF